MIIEDFLAKANPTNQQDRIRQFAFADHNVISSYPEQFRALLKEIIDRKLKVSFYALGNINAHDLVDDPELASLLLRAGFKQLVFADDRRLPLTEEAREEWLVGYRYAIESCGKAGYRWGTSALARSISVGRPGETIEDIASFFTKLSYVS